MPTSVSIRERPNGAVGSRRDVREAVQQAQVFGVEAFRLIVRHHPDRSDRPSIRPERHEQDFADERLDIGSREMFMRPRKQHRVVARDDRTARASTKRHHTAEVGRPRACDRNPAEPMIFHLVKRNPGRFREPKLDNQVTKALQHGLRARSQRFDERGGRPVFNFIVRSAGRPLR